MVDQGCWQYNHFSYESNWNGYSNGTSKNSLDIWLYQPCFQELVYKINDTKSHICPMLSNLFVVPLISVNEKTKHIWGFMYFAIDEIQTIFDQRWLVDQKQERHCSDRQHDQERERKNDGCLPLDQSCLQRLPFFPFENSFFLRGIFPAATTE